MGAPGPGVYMLLARHVVDILLLSPLTLLADGCAALHRVTEDAQH